MSRRFAFTCTTSVLCAFLCTLSLTATAQQDARTTLSGFEDTTNTQQDVFYQGTDQHIYFRYYTNGIGWQVQDTTALSGALPALVAGPVTSFYDTLRNQQHAVFQGTDRHIYQVYSNSNPATWAVQDITAAAGATGTTQAFSLLSYADASLGIQYVFYLDDSEHVKALVFYGGGWSQIDLNATTGAPLPIGRSNLAGFVENQSHTAHLFYQGLDRDIHEFYASGITGSIGIADDTASAGASVALPLTSLTGFFDANHQQENLFYMTYDRHIHRLLFSYSTDTWQDEDATALSGSIFATTEASLSSFEDDARNQQHVVFVGNDGHLRQLYFSGAWAMDDLTADGVSPAPAELTPLATFKDAPDAQQHVFYGGTDNQFYHAWFDTQWHYQLLTGATNPTF